MTTDVIENFTLYGEARSFEDAEQYIDFKIETEGWNVLVPPFPLPPKYRLDMGVRVFNRSFGFYLHKYNPNIKV